MVYDELKNEIKEMKDTINFLVKTNEALVMAIQRHNEGVKEMNIIFREMINDKK